MFDCNCDQIHQRRKIALTGGPGAGKTAVLELVRQYFCRHMELLPEAAGILFGGDPLRRGSSSAGAFPEENPRSRRRPPSGRSSTSSGSSSAPQRGGRRHPALRPGHPRRARLLAWPRGSLRRGWYQPERAALPLRRGDPLADALGGERIQPPEQAAHRVSGRGRGHRREDRPRLGRPTPTLLHRERPQLPGEGEPGRRDSALRAPRLLPAAPSPASRVSPVAPPCNEPRGCPVCLAQPLPYCSRVRRRQRGSR
jgi:hypothetical protein